MKWLGQGITFFGLYIIYSGTFGQPNYRTFGLDWTTAIVFILVGMVIVLIGGIITSKGMKVETTTIDIETVGTLGKLKHSSGPFSLYLRPFDLTGKFEVQGGPANLFDWGQYDRPGRDFLERAFADALKPTAPLIGLGERGEVEYGPGSGGFVENWQEKIRAAMASAVYILVVPSANAGTLWEIGEIKRSGYFPKTIFIMPPTVGAIKYSGLRTYAEVWTEARASCARDHEIDLPEYNPAGAILSIAHDSMKVRQQEFGGFEPREIAKAINRLLS